MTRDRSAERRLLETGHDLAHRMTDSEYLALCNLATTMRRIREDAAFSDDRTLRHLRRSLLHATEELSRKLEVTIRRRFE